MTNFIELYQTNKGLSADQKRELVASLPNDIAFDEAFSGGDVSPSDLISILETYGPFWVTLDADPSNRRKQHAVVVSGVSSEARENAEVAYYDVATGRVETSNFTDFIERVIDGNEDLSECLIRRVNKIGEGAKNILPDSYTIPAGAQVYILAAAFNYSTRKYSFSSFTDKYRKKVAAGIPSSQVDVFIMVDFKGSITYYEDGVAKAKKLFTEVDSDNYPLGSKAFDFQLTNGYISKDTIYDLITDIGTNNPGQLKEVGIFSHAYYVGPILLNTYKPGTTEFTTRLAADANYQDMDCRMSDIAGLDTALFKAAFATDGIFKVWGCSADSHLNFIVKKVISSSLYKRDGTTADATEFTVPDYAFGSSGTKISDRFSSHINSVSGGNVKITMGNMKKLLAFEYTDTFAATLAETIDITVQSALPGTYASIGDAAAGEAAANAGIFRISYDTAANVNIFEKYLSVSIGELKYGLFTKASVTAARLI